MTRRAPRVCITQVDTERLCALIATLPAHGRVVLHLRDGSPHAGGMHVRESMQVFRDPNREEGLNAEIALESEDVAGVSRYVWLDEDEHVELDSALAREN
ncbi:MAG: DUF3247 family protein [Rhodanobacter sp.]